jgi:hypothetical protein
MPAQYPEAGGPSGPENDRPNIDHDRGSERSGDMQRPGDGDRETAHEEYDEQVRERFEQYLDQAKKESPDANSHDLAEIAWRISFEARKTDDSFQRDVEHYGYCFFMAVKRDLIGIGGCQMAPAYDLLKALAIGLSSIGIPAAEKALRANPDQKISTPGWRDSVQAFHGLYDGWPKNNEHQDRTRDQFSTDLPSLP